MYEHYLAAFRNGITDITLEIDDPEYWPTNEDEGSNGDAVNRPTELEHEIRMIDEGGETPFESNLSSH